MGGGGGGQVTYWLCNVDVDRRDLLRGKFLMKLSA